MKNFKILYSIIIVALLLFSITVSAQNEFQRTYNSAKVGNSDKAAIFDLNYAKVWFNYHEENKIKVLIIFENETTANFIFYLKKNKKVYKSDTIGEYTINRAINLNNGDDCYFSYLKDLSKLVFMDGDEFITLYNKKQ